MNVHWCYYTPRLLKRFGLFGLWHLTSLNFEYCLDAFSLHWQLQFMLRLLLGFMRMTSSEQVGRLMTPPLV